MTKSAVERAMIALGVDIGTTSITAVAFDVEHRRLLAKASALNMADVTPAERRAEGWAELDLDRVFAAVLAVLSEVVLQLGTAATRARVLGVTGQMHGTAVLDRAGRRSLRPAITWQDQRAAPLIPQMLARVDVAEAGASCGCLPAAGYLGATLFWMQQHGQLPKDAVACCIPDAIAAWLAGCAPTMGDTLAASTGIFDIVHNEWSRPWLEALALPPSLLPRVVASGAPLGTLNAELTRHLGLPSEVIVHAAIGDHQASLVGSECIAPNCLHINVGTGAQVSLVSEHFLPPNPELGIETRPFVDQLYLRSGAVLSGGQTFAILLRFFRSVFDLFGVAVPDEAEMYRVVVQAALSAPSGAEGVRAETSFDGARHAPDKRASLSGLSRANFSAANLCRAIVEGVAEELWQFAQAMGVKRGLRASIVGAGNAIRRNAALRQALADRFGAELVVPPWEEEAAVGAAWRAAGYAE
ncbi:MAG: FGGY family carbohydrate kinase [Anaerolineae bacterium]|nr:FGGY family carbohydrate kinase [Anaerolineae bacterium]